MKKAKKAKTKKVEDPTLEYGERLAELEAELRSYPADPKSGVALASIEDPEEDVLGEEKVVQFQLQKTTYAVGHTDQVYADTNHSRGVRHIQFYVEKKVVLSIEGDFEDQQFGSNFRFHNIEKYTPGEWEGVFLKLSDELRDKRAKRREANRKLRAKALR